MNKQTSWGPHSTRDTAVLRNRGVCSHFSQFSSLGTLNPGDDLYISVDAKSVITSDNISGAQCPFPLTCTICNLRVVLRQLGAATLRLVLNVNGVDTDLGITFPPGSTEKRVYADLTHDVKIQEGDLLCFQLYVGTEGNPNTSRLGGFSFRMEG